MPELQQARKDKPAESRPSRTAGTRQPELAAPRVTPAGRFEEDAARLAAARSEQERAEIALGLQQAYGNAYVQRLVQAKLTVSQPGDVYEQEADRVAADVTRGAGEQTQRQAIDDEDEIQAKLASNVQREEEAITKVDSDGGLLLSEPLETKIDAARSGGQPLADTARAEMEPRLGVDLGSVRVHTDSEADQLARDLSAEAFTTGRDVFFRSGTYQPETQPGQTLLAHELTHVVQQQAAPAVQRDVTPDEDELVANMEAAAVEQTTAEEAAPSVNAAEQAPSEAAVPAQNAAEQVASAPSAVEPAPAPEPAVPAPTAVEQAPSVNVAGPSTTQEAATAAAPVNAAGPSAAPEATGTEAARLEAMRGMWDFAVVGAIRDAYNALAQARPNAGTALERLSSTAPVVGAVKDAYRDRNPSAYMTLTAFYQYLARRSGELRPHTEYETVSLDEIREGINPDGEAMRQWLSEVSAAL